MQKEKKVGIILKILDQVGEIAIRIVLQAAKYAVENLETVEDVV